MKTVRSTNQDTWYDIVDGRGRNVGQAVSNDGGTHYVTGGPVIGVYRSRAGMLDRLRAVHGSGVRLCVGQRRPARRPPVATGGPTYTATAVKPRPPSGPTGGAPRTGAPTTPGSARSAPGGAGYMLWRFPSTAQPPPMLRPMPVRPALGLSEILPTGSLGSHGILCGGVSKLPPKSDANMTPVARPRPTRRPGGAGTGRRLPR
mgnify:CR=1 FL=1